MLAFAGFLMMIIIIVLLLKSKVLPMVSFIVVPIIFALLLGFSVDEIASFAQEAVLKNAKMAVLFMFSIIFFGVINDTGMFDRIIGRLIGFAGKHVIAVTVLTVIVATIGHIDGSIATTFLITIPAMLPLYKRMKMNPLVLMTLCTTSLGVMNLTPWGGHLNRVATVMEMDINLLWHELIPIQVAGFVLSIGLAVILGHFEVKNGAGFEEEHDSLKTNDAIESDLVRPKMFYVNLGIVIITILMLALTKIQPFVIFMVSMALALLINYPNTKMQEERIKAHAGPALVVSQTLLAAGILIGILKGTGMIDAMALSIVQFIPTAVGNQLALIMGILSTPFALLFSTDAYYFGILPVAASVGEEFAIAPISMSIAMLVGRNVALTLSPLVAATLLGCGLAEVELKDHIRFSFKWVWGLSLLLIIFSILIGIVPI